MANNHPGGSFEQPGGIGLSDWVIYQFASCRADVPSGSGIITLLVAHGHRAPSVVDYWLVREVWNMQKHDKSSTMTQQVNKRACFAFQSCAAVPGVL